MGDNPVVLHNETPSRFGGNLGWKCVGLQIYLPILPDLCIGVWCNGVFGFEGRNIRKNEQEINTLRIMTGHNASAQKALNEDQEALKNSRFNFDNLYRSITLERELIATPDNMKFYNKLQVTWAQRLICSRDGSFYTA